MGNASGKEEDEVAEDGACAGAGDDAAMGSEDGLVRRARSEVSMGATPPQSPERSRSPLMFAPQVPVAPLQGGADVPPVFNQLWAEDSPGYSDAELEKGIPTLITWNHGGKDVSVEGSWDNWTSRRSLQKTGKDRSILLVLPSGIYQYKFFVDGEWRYVADLPHVADETGHIANLLDVHEHVPENLVSVSEFELPPSPDSSYSQPFPIAEDLSKEPPVVPPQLNLSILGMQRSDDVSLKPQHVVLNHLFIEKGLASQPLVALGLSHRFQSKYVTVILYKSLRS